MPKFGYLSDQTLAIFIQNSFGKKLGIFDVEEAYKLCQ
tara:strand:+ start:162 stop:275 length:114 start_codon:yes stop_codon:yes gene_type:complete